MNRPSTGFPALARACAVVGARDVFAEQTWFTWTAGWLMRVVLQVTFFALLGSYVGGTGQTRYLLIGGAANVAALEALTVMLYSAHDRLGGTLPLLVAAPRDYFLVLLSRYPNCVVTGTLTSSIALLSCPLLVGVHLEYPRALLAVPVIALGATATYVFGGFLGGIVIKVRSGRWLLLNIGWMSMAILCGFTIRVGYWPAPLTWLAQILPFTHALRALRGVLGDATVALIVGQCALEAAVAVLWFVVGRSVLGLTIERARRDGSIQLSS